MKRQEENSNICLASPVGQTHIVTLYDSHNCSMREILLNYLIFTNEEIRP